jgi:hypothetical protein
MDFRLVLLLLQMKFTMLLCLFSGSVDGLDSLKPQHLKDLILDKPGLSSSNLLSSLTKIIDLMFLGLYLSKLVRFFMEPHFVLLVKKMKESVQ